MRIEFSKRDVGKSIVILFKLSLGSTDLISVSKYTNDITASIADIRSKPSNILLDTTEVFFFFDLKIVFFALILFLLEEFLLA
jgi:hypothetical protein